MSVRRAGLPLTVTMRHNAHYVEEITSRTGAAIGRMIPLEEIQPNASQPRKEIGDLHRRPGDDRRAPLGRRELCKGGPVE